MIGPRGQLRRRYAGSGSVRGAGAEAAAVQGDVEVLAWPGATREVVQVRSSVESAQPPATARPAGLPIRARQPDLLPGSAFRSWACSVSRHGPASGLVHPLHTSPKEPFPWALTSPTCRRPTTATTTSLRLLRTASTRPRWPSSTRGSRWSVSLTCTTTTVIPWSSTTPSCAARRRGATRFTFQLPARIATAPSATSTGPVSCSASRRRWACPKDSGRTRCRPW